MELKPYQQRVIQDLHQYLERLAGCGRIDQAFNELWEERIGPYNPLDGSGMPPYRNTLPGVPHLCLKVPTAGGKTYIAVNALDTIFGRQVPGSAKMVVWLVPWSNLLDQTYGHLNNPDHPYRRRLNTLFQHRVAVYRKEELLQGAGFSPVSVQDQLSIVVMSFASLRAKRKEDRKVYQENGQLAGFASGWQQRDHVLEGYDDSALINVIRSFEPVVVVDESHNAESELSVDMLRNLNPSLVLDLTATPRPNSNILSMVPAIALKREHMVKLPVIVYNHHKREEVINSALHLQAKLERKAAELHAAGASYIRPIVLFQAQPRTAADNHTFEKVREALMALGIPAEQVKIKTAEIDELKGINLMARDCPVRYIITVNALKEGWDCPFAYVLASLADKSSAVDVEQILGRVLRQPYVMKQGHPMLNVSYVLTASAKFQETLNGIVQSLQNNGFSSKDYRAQDKAQAQAPQTEEDILDQAFSGNLFTPPEANAGSDTSEINIQEIQYRKPEKGAAPYAPSEAVHHPELPADPTVSTIEQLAVMENAAMEAKVKEQEGLTVEDPIIMEIPDKVRSYQLVDTVRQVAKEILLPQFTMQIPASILTPDGGQAPLNRDSLLANFKLGKKDIDIDFEQMQAEIYQVDLTETIKDQFSPHSSRLNLQVSDAVAEYILSRPQETQIKALVSTMARLIGNIYPIADKEMQAYIQRIMDELSANQVREVMGNVHGFTARIQAKIKLLVQEHAEKVFNEWVAMNKLQATPTWRFADRIIPGRMGPAVHKSMYEREGDMNHFEQSFIMRVAALENVRCWHRNLSRKGFAINGFMSDHYPDFIVLTQAGNCVLVETKGGHLDNSDSYAKLRLAKQWESMAGRNYKYMMVFESNPIPDAYSVEAAMRILGGL